MRYRPPGSVEDCPRPYPRDPSYEVEIERNARTLKMYQRLLESAREDGNKLREKRCLKSIAHFKAVIEQLKRDQAEDIATAEKKADDRMRGI